MQLPVKAHYATLAMLALAQKHASGDLLPAKVIAREQNIPCQFLLQIMQQLRAAGLISSVRGAQGGFALNRVPEQISVAEVVDAVCHPQANSPEESADPLASAVSEVWDDLQQQQRQILEGVTLGGLLQRASQTVPMFYI